MNKIDRKAWTDKTKRLNEGVELKRGMVVRDVEGNLGVVVKIIEASEDFHGVVYVWQCDRVEYGSDNFEHYCANNWQEFLRIS